ncbi:MAG: ATP-binding cassette domain-containing protein [Chloroflexi bacterium]|nr:ATP-binding cassette domain-containing protein [Chloroflexota bacterium]
MPEPQHSSLPEIEIADLVWQPAGADAPTLDLRGSTIHIGAGETLLISGASGAGKSTLAAAIAGLLGTLLPGTLSGTLRVGGVDLVAAAAEGAAGVPRELLGQLGFVAASPSRSSRAACTPNFLSRVPERRSPPPASRATRRNATWRASVAENARRRLPPPHSSPHPDW